MREETLLVGIRVFIKEAPQRSLDPSALREYPGSLRPEKGPHTITWHPDFGLLASRPVSNKFLLLINHLVSDFFFLIAAGQTTKRELSNRFRRAM